MEEIIEENGLEPLISHEMWRLVMDYESSNKRSASSDRGKNFEWLKSVDTLEASLKTSSEAGTDGANAGGDLSSLLHVKDPRSSTTPVVAYLQRPEPIAVEALDEHSWDEMRRGAGRFGLQIAAVCIEHCARGRSGHRPALQEAIAFCKRGGARGVIVDDVDRLSRRAWILPSLMGDLQSCDSGLWDLGRGRVSNSADVGSRANLIYRDYEIFCEKVRLGILTARRRRNQRNDI